MKSIEHSERVVDYFDEHRDQNNRYVSARAPFTNIGQAKFKLGEYEDALRYSKISMDFHERYWKENKNNLGALADYSITLQNYIEILCAMKKIEDAKNHLQILKGLPRDHHRVEIGILIGSAKIYLSSHRLRDQMSALESVEKLLSHEKADFEDLIHGRKMIFDILLTELSQTGEEDVLEEINQHLEQQLQLSITENLTIQRLEVMLIKAKIKFIAEDLERALFLVEQVIDEALHLGITSVYNAAIVEKGIIEEEIKSFDDNSRRYSSLKERINRDSIQEYIIQVQNHLKH